MIKNVIGSLSFLLFYSCASVNPELDPKVYYMRDVKFHVAGKVKSGVITVPKQYRYNIKFQLPGDGDLVTFSTCHQERILEDVGKSGQHWYVPKSIEDKGCPAQIAAFEYGKGRHSWGMIAFEDPAFKLQAHIKCNGYMTTANGVYACQSRKGLRQHISFREEVYQADNESCPELPTKDNQVFEYDTPPRECIYLFQGKKSGEQFTLYTIGYEEILVRNL